VLGLCFLVASVPIVFHLMKVPSVPEGTPIWHFNQAFMPTGYMMFVKVIELIGAILVMVPRLRNMGLLLLGPVIVNILAFSTFVTNGQGLLNPLVIVVVVCALFLLWDSRARWMGLVGAPVNAGR
jgi:hypothetical protein